jgi:hypothetical protein
MDLNIYNLDRNPRLWLNRWQNLKTFAEIISVTSISGDFSGFAWIQNSRGSRQIFPKKVTSGRLLCKYLCVKLHIILMPSNQWLVYGTYKLRAGLRICVHYIRYGSGCSISKNLASGSRSARFKMPQYAKNNYIIFDIFITFENLELQKGYR